MVHWFTWANFLDALYFSVNPQFKEEYFKAQMKRETALEMFDLSKEVDEDGSFWFDFVADTGDGFNPTYSVAYTMALPSVNVLCPSTRASPSSSSVLVLPRPNVIIHGGDIAYPFPREDEYLSRFFAPYSAAFAPAQVQHSASPLEQKIYFIPGNHEWFDGLRLFRQTVLDASTKRSIGRLKIPQSSPYLALKLPFGWYFFIVDLGPPDIFDIDDNQLLYFNTILSEMNDDDRVILGIHVPDWIANSTLGHCGGRKFQLWRKIQLGHRLKLTLAGDLHYYKRMDSSPPPSSSSSSEVEDINEWKETQLPNLIVAGHGGAFSHSTSNPKCESAWLGFPHVPVEQRTFYTTKKNYPSPSECDSAWRQNWYKGFSPSHNAMFGCIFGFVYLNFFAALTPARLLSNNNHLASTIIFDGMLSSLFFYIAVLWLWGQSFVLSTTCYGFKGRPKTFAFALLLTFIHTFSHLIVAFSCRIIFDGVVRSTLRGNRGDYDGISELVMYNTSANIYMYICGFGLGPITTGLYFYVTFSYLQWHFNEAYCAWEDQEHKGFLRINIRPVSGAVEIYACALKKTAVSWQDVATTTNSTSSNSLYQPTVPIVVELIEKIRILKDK